MNFRNNQGASSLTLVLIIASVFILLLTGILAFISLTTQQSSLAINTKKVSFLAEGHLFEIANKLLIDPYWRPSTMPYEAVEIMPDGSRVYQSIRETTQGVVITVSAESGNTLRTFRGLYTANSSTKNYQPIDIVLVIDRSESMDHPLSSKTGPSSMELANQAAAGFVRNILEEKTHLDARIGLVYFQNSANRILNLTNDTNQLIDFLDRPALGGTNLSDGLYQAHLMLENFSDPSRDKILVVLSDGVPSYSIDETPLAPRCATPVCGSDMCMAPETMNTGFAPNNRGICCSNQAITIANSIKSQGATIYSISLTENYPVTNSQCYNPSGTRWYSTFNEALEKSKELGSRTLFELSNDATNGDRFEDRDVTGKYYLETPDSNELADLYDQIAEDIADSVKFVYQEIEPIPIPPGL